MSSSSLGNLSARGRRCADRIPLLFWAGLLAALLCLRMCLEAGSAIAAQAPRDEAESVLFSYFTALQTGDVEALGWILGGELRDSMSALLENPDYGSDLVRDYGGADFEIVDLQSLDSGDVVATVDTLLPPYERLRHRLTLRRGGSSEGIQIVRSEFVP